MCTQVSLAKDYYILLIFSYKYEEILNIETKRALYALKLEEALNSNSLEILQASGIVGKVLELSVIAGDAERGEESSTSKSPTGSRQ